MSNTVIAVANTNLSRPVIYRLIAKYSTKGNISPYYVQVMFDNFVESDKTLIICDQYIYNNLARDFKVDPLEAPSTLGDKQVKGLKINIPSQLLLGQAQEHLLRVLSCLNIWFSGSDSNYADKSLFSFSYPGASRFRDIHGGYVHLLFNEPLPTKTMEIIKVVMEHQFWPLILSGDPANQSDANLFFQTEWLMKDDKVQLLTNWVDTVKKSIKNSEISKSKEDEYNPYGLTPIHPLAELK